MLLVSAVLRRGTVDATSRLLFRAGYHWRQFHIDDTGHDDWRGTDTDPEPRTIHVRFSRVPESMVDALHGIRAVERRFGRIRDYRLLRDSEIPSEYQSICWAAFESPGSLLRVPPRGTTLKVPLPPSLGRPEGGLGLNDLTSLLDPANHSKSDPSGLQEKDSEPSRCVVLTIKRADTPITFRNAVRPAPRSRAMKVAIGHRFLEWGGFAPLEPLHASSPFTSPAVDSPPLDSKHMRMALNKWSQICGVPDPLFPEMKQPVNETEIRQKGVEGEWEPLSEPPWLPERGEEAARVAMPRGPQESLRQSLESLLQPPSKAKTADSKVQNGVS